MHRVTIPLLAPTSPARARVQAHTNTHSHSRTLTAYICVCLQLIRKHFNTRLYLFVKPQLIVFSCFCSLPLSLAPLPLPLTLPVVRCAVTTPRRDTHYKRFRASAAWLHCLACCCCCSCFRIYLCIQFVFCTCMLFYRCRRLFAWILLFSVYFNLAWFRCFTLCRACRCFLCV